LPDHVPESHLTVEHLAKATYLRPDQRGDLQRSIAEQQERLANPVVFEMAGGDPETVRQQVAKEQAMLAHGTPPQLPSVQLAKVRRLEQHLREQITHALPTYGMMERGRPTDIDHHVAWEREHKKRVLAWKACLQILDPGNTEPNFLSVARLRGDTVRGDPRRYTQNFDQIKWDEVIEDDLIRDMDDSAYHHFLELKLLNWSKPNICKELSWSPKMYEAAMERLRQSHQGARTADEDEDDPELNYGAEDAEDDEALQITLPGTEAVREAASHPTRFQPAERVQKPAGWFAEALRELGMSRYKFCKESGLSDSQLRHSDLDGRWTRGVLEKAETTIEALKKHAEPAQTAEPAQQATRSLWP
jgi:hypothetical protein